MDKNIWIITHDLKKLFSSPNPLAIYFNSKEIRDKFSKIISDLTNSISESFDLWDSSSVMNHIYKTSNYHHVWNKEFSEYITLSKDFDLWLYFDFLFLLDHKKKEILENLKSFYDWLWTQKYSKEVYDIHEKLDLNNIFIEDSEKLSLKEFLIELYFTLVDNRDNFRDLIDFEFNTKTDFQISLDIFNIVLTNYSDKNKKQSIKKVLNFTKLSTTKLEIDKLIYDFEFSRKDFLLSVHFLTRTYSKQEKETFNQYINYRLIDTYFNNIRDLFYIDGSRELISSDRFSNLSAKYQNISSHSPHWEFINSQINELISLKGLIFDLQRNIFSSFLLPIVYFIVSDKINLREKDLYKVKYVLLFILSDNYHEYKKIYKFFNQLEVFLNYSKKVNLLEKLSVSGALIWATIISFLLAYYYMPIWVSLWIVLFSIVTYSSYLFPNLYYKSKLNLWLKFFAILFLSVSSYFWFTNLDEVKKDWEKAMQYVEKLWIIKTRDVAFWVGEFVKTSLLDRK